MEVSTPVSYRNVKLNDGFWKTRQQTNAGVTVPAVWEQFYNTGRLSAMDLTWREGEDNRPHIFYDSDMAKWLEGAAYTLTDYPNKDAEDKIELIIDKIERGMTAEGYFNSYYLTVEPQKRWTVRRNHELYCAGHLMEAAVAYFQVTGKRRLLDLMLRYGDYIYKIFVEDKSAAFETPGHEEIELALIRVWHVTGEKKWLDLAGHFISKRGTLLNDPSILIGNFVIEQAQDHAPVVGQTEPMGHVVRFMYLYAAVADAARETKDERYLEACQRLWRYVLDKKMYITGGVGNMAHGEAFGPDYFLPNFEAYTETCASIGMAYWARRMLQIDPRGEYADIIELQMYNGALAGVSLDGKSFFYENPLQMRPGDQRFLTAAKANKRPTQRVRVFSCSCCPPNILRFIASVGDYIYTSKEGTLFVNQYMQSRSDVTLGGVNLTLSQVTKYPWDGGIEITVGNPGLPVNAAIALRIPGWCEEPSVNYAYAAKDGYWYIEREWKDGDVIKLSLPMTVMEIEANPMIAQNAGKAALRRGPFIYCVEQEDNPEGVLNLRIPHNAEYSVRWNDALLGGINTIHFEALRGKSFAEAYRRWSPEYEITNVTAVPYFLWANRSDGEMTVWINKSAGK